MLLELKIMYYQVMSLHVRVLSFSEYVLTKINGKS